MTIRTVRLHEAILAPLKAGLITHSDLDQKPLDVDLALPAQVQLRFYAYTLVGGVGERARREFKVVLRVPGQGVGEYGEFTHETGRFTTIVGYAPDLDVFVLWDASLHPRFKNGGNLQVRDSVVWEAAAQGTSEQVRRLGSGAREVVLACRSADLWRALEGRIAATGGLGQDEWATFLS